MSDLIFPYYFRILEKQPDAWFLMGTKVFYNSSNYEYNPDRAWVEYGISKQSLTLELFRRFGGKLGFYLVDLKHKQYYYCGLQEADVKNTLLSLGIGRKDYS